MKTMKKKYFKNTQNLKLTKIIIVQSNTWKVQSSGKWTIDKK